MMVLCPACGAHHEVTRILEDESSELTREVFLVDPNGECDTSVITEAQIRGAVARFDREPWLDDDDPP